MLSLGTAVQGEGPSPLTIWRKVCRKEEEAVAAACRCRRGVILNVHPGRLRIGLGYLDRLSKASGTDRIVHGIGIEAEGVAAAAVESPGVVIGPRTVLQRTFEGPSIADYPAVNALDASFFQQGFPFPEQAVSSQRNTVARGYGRVSSADNIDVALERAVSNFAGIGKAGLKAKIGAEGVHSRTGGDEFQVGSRDHPDQLVA